MCYIQIDFKVCAILAEKQVIVDGNFLLFSMCETQWLIKVKELNFVQ